MLLAVVSGFSHSSDKLVEMEKYVAGVGGETDLVFVVGAMSHSKIGCDYIDDYISGKLFLDSVLYDHLMQKSCTVSKNQ
ncbi:hypothetical protein DKX38_023644 [Salix brachista]|uniref:Uncharacterized protein n=1 Tax=Salix brachista TaxID=2182728 RepID=A0A5N5JQF6_9ROSI|nr:hypothetical protein DKX38_023644 [Salix brachista]